MFFKPIYYSIFIKLLLNFNQSVIETNNYIKTLALRALKGLSSNRVETDLAFDSIRFQYLNCFSITFILLIIIDRRQRQKHRKCYRVTFFSTEMDDQVISLINYFVTFWTLAYKRDNAFSVFLIGLNLFGFINSDKIFCSID